MRRLLLVLPLLLLPLLVVPPVAARERVELDPAAPAPAYLAIVDSGPRGAVPRRQRLVLVSPDGAVATLLRRTVRRPGDVMDLADVSRDGRTVLLRTGRARGRSTAMSLDLTTGETRTLRLGAAVRDVRLTRRGGGLVLRLAGGRQRRLAWDGTGAAPGHRVPWRPDARIAVAGAHRRAPLALGARETVHGRRVVEVTPRR